MSPNKAKSHLIPFQLEMYISTMHASILKKKSNKIIVRTGTEIESANLTKDMSKIPMFGLQDVCSFP